MEVANRNLVAVRSGMHAADEADVVGDAAGLGQQLGKFHAAFAVLRELEPRTEQFCTRREDVAVADVFVVVGSVEPGEFGLRIRQIHV